MKNFEVLYFGQVRYIECLKTHEEIISGNQGISVCLTVETKEGPGLESNATNSISGNLSIQEIETVLNSTFVFKNIRLLTNESYIEYNYDSPDFFPCNLFYTLALAADSVDSNFVFCLTTDLIFKNQEKYFERLLEKFDVVEEPTAYGILFRENDIDFIMPSLLCLNKSAIEQIRSNWKSQLDEWLLSSEPLKQKNEYATRCLLEKLGIRFVNIPFNPGYIRFRANMNFNTAQENFNSLYNKFLEYSQEKQKRIRARWSK